MKAATLGAPAARRATTWALKTNVLARTSTILVALIVFGVLARAYRIDAPLFGWYQVRAFDTAAMARNFHEGSMNILYPQIDWGGDTPGYAEAEFQAYTFLVALLAHPFGFHEWIGRSLNIVFYVLSAILLFMLSRRLFDDVTGLFAVFFYSVVPVSYYFTRGFQPDPLMGLASLAGVYFFLMWAEEGRRPALAASAVGVALAVLIKPTSLYLGLPLLYLSHRRFGWALFRQPALWIFALAVIIPAFMWYAHALSLWNDYGNSLGASGGAARNGLWSPTDSRWRPYVEVLLARLNWELATPPGFLLLVVGILGRFRWKNYLLHWWAAGFAAYLMLVPVGNWHHLYYQLPIVFVTAAFMAVGTRFLLEKQVLGRVAVAGLCLAVVGYSYWMLRDFLRPWPIEHEVIAFGQAVNRATEPGELIILVYPGGTDAISRSYFNHRTAQGISLPSVPTEFYLSHRKGWSLHAYHATPAFVNELQARGARYFATFGPGVFEENPELKNWLDRYHTPIDVASNWTIFRLTEPTVEQPPLGTTSWPGGGNNSRWAG